jgi:acetyl/propionyl-CoA carboxylase alpha subunit
MRKILVANRGEIACRIGRTARRMGLAVATVHSSADADALHVREIGESVLLGDGPARSSYLDIAAVVAAARRVGADAVHPGFGFLSENAAFARACADGGLAFIGPSPEVLALFGDKAEAKRLARQLDIPTAGGLAPPTEDIEALLALVAGMPLPCILKAAAGGGGKGMRVLREGAGASAAIESAIREGRSAFGDGRLIVERYLAAPRHIEVQILGDGQGNVVHLHDRECSLQRRFQKVVEEAPVTSLPQPLRERLWAHAIALGSATRYRGLATVEFAVTGDDAAFLEVNPRLQVEHPVTEAVTGLDLVQLQIETVASGRLPFAQDEVPAPRGVAVQARLYAEDPDQGFLPCTGRVAAFAVPAGVRCDAGVAAGSEVTPHYDPMLAKLVAHAPSRAQALQQLHEALAGTALLGVISNRGFLLALLADPQVRENAISTEFIDRWLAARAAAVPASERIAAAMALWLARERAQGAAGGAWQDAALTGWRMRRGAEADVPAVTHLAASGSAGWKIGFGPGVVRVDERNHAVAVNAADATVSVDGRMLALRVDLGPAHARCSFPDGDLPLDVRPLHAAEDGSSTARHGLVRAPMMGVVIAVDVRPGQQVAAGERLATLESMKMELAITAPVAGRVAAVGCTAQGKVERHQELFRIQAE